MTRCLLLAIAILLTFTGCDEAAPAPKPAKPAPAVTKIQVLDFYATWCGPCKVNAPGIDQIEREGTRIARIDIDKQGDVALQYKITSVPTYVVLKNGVEIGRCQSVSELRVMLGKAPQQPRRQPNFDRSHIPPNERSINHNLQH